MTRLVNLTSITGKKKKENLIKCLVKRGWNRIIGSLYQYNNLKKRIYFFLPISITSISTSSFKNADRYKQQTMAKYPFIYV